MRCGGRTTSNNPKLFFTVGGLVWFHFLRFLCGQLGSVHAECDTMKNFKGGYEYRPYDTFLTPKYVHKSARFMSYVIVKMSDLALSEVYCDNEKQDNNLMASCNWQTSSDNPKRCADYPPKIPYIRDQDESNPYRIYLSKKSTAIFVSFRDFCDKLEHGILDLKSASGKRMLWYGGASNCENFCPEISRTLRSNFGTPRSLKIDEKHEMIASDLDSTVMTVKEGIDVTLTMYAHMCDQTQIIMLLFYEREKKLSHIKIYPSAKEKSYPEDQITYEDFTERITMAEKSGRNNIYTIDFQTGSIGYNDMYLIILATHRSKRDMEEHTDSLINKWYEGKYKDQSFTQVVQPTKTTSIRAIRLKTSYDTIQKLGSTKKFYSRGLKSSATLQCSRSCNHSKVSVKDFTVHNGRVELKLSDIVYSGEYTCQEGENTLFSNVPVIVHPVNENIQIFVGDRGEEPSKNFGRTDGKGNYYVKTPPRIMCQYNFSNCLHNTQRNDLYPKGNWLRTSYAANETNLTHIMSVTYEVTKLLQEKYYCYYSYEKTGAIQQSTEVNYKATSKEIRLHQYSAIQPTILNDTVKTTSWSLTEKLQQTGSISPRVTTNATLNESWISGEFDAYLSPKYSWGSIWLVVEDENQVRSRVDCHSTHKNTDTKNEQGQVLVRYKFGCSVTVSAVQMVFSLYDTGTDHVTPVEVEKKYTEFILGRGKTEPNLMPPTMRFLRLIDLDVRWRATIVAGDQMLVLCHKDADIVEDYAIGWRTRSSNEYTWYRAGTIWKARISEIPNQRLFSMDDQYGSVHWSGYYRCQFKSNLNQKTWTGRPRKLVILHGLEDINIFYKTKKSEKSSIDRTHSSPEKPLFIDETHSFIVWCEYWLNFDVFASISMIVTHESYNEDGRYVVQATEQKEEEEILPDWYGKKCSVKYELKIPSYYDYHNHSRFACVLNVSKLERDPADVLPDFKEHFIRDIRYVRYPLKPIEGRIYNISFKAQMEMMRSAEETEKHLKENKQGKERDVIQEGLYELNYTVFLGHPRGAAKLWIIRRLSSGEHTMEIPKVIKYTNTSCGEHSKGKCEEYQAKFVLQITDVGLTILLVRPKIAENGDVDHEENKRKISQMLKEAFRLGRGDDVVKIPTQDLVQFNMVQIKPCWPALVETGGNFTIYSRSDDKSCTHTRLLNSSKRSVKTTNISDSGAVQVSKSGVSISDSGLYWCSANITHELVVTPNEDLVEIHLGSAFAFSDQTVQVECAYNTTGLRNLKPDVSLLTEKGKGVEAKPGSDDGKTGDVYEVRTVFNFTAPGSKDFEGGTVNLTCHFAYPHITPPDCCNEKKDFSLSKTAQIIIKLRASPKIFPQTLLTNPKGMLSRMEQGLKDQMSAIDFQETASKIRLNETILTGSVILNLGVPRGKFVMYVFRKHNNKMLAFDCNVTTQDINDTKPKVEYNEAHGKSFVNASFKCIMQAEDEAVVLLVYSKSECNDSGEVVECTIRNSTEIIVKHWLENPANKTEQKFNIPYGVLAATAAIKLKLGYCASVHVNTTWSMLARGEEGTRCFRKINKDDDKYEDCNIEKETGGGTYFWLQKKQANYSDSGYYKCDNSVESGFPERTLIVLPADSMMSISLKITNESKNLQSQKGKKTNVYVYYNQSFEVRCGFPQSQMRNLTPTVDLVYNRRGQTGPDREELPNKGNPVNFRITAPFPSYPERNLTVTCVVKYGELKPINLDTCESSVKREFKTSEDIELKPRNCPKLYKNGIKSNRMVIFERIDSGMKDQMTAQDFEDTSSPELIPEGLVTVSMFQDVGRPYGSPSLHMFRGNGTDLFERKCTGGVKRNITRRQELPFLLWKEFSANPFKKFVETSFTCIVRRCDEMMAFITHSKICSDTDGQIENKLVKSIKNNWKEWHKSPVDLKAVELPADVLAKFAIIKLNIGYRATVRISEPWNITGILPSDNSTLQCYYSSDQKTHTLLNQSLVNQSSDGYFILGKSNADYSDSGYYFCNSSNINDSEAGFHTRKLLVLPNNDTLSIRLEVSGASLTKNNQGRYHLYSNQDLTVKCIFKKPNLPILKYTVRSEYKVIDNKGKIVCSFYKSGLPEYKITPPRTNGIIKLACQVADIRADPIEHDLSPLKHPITLHKEAEIELEMVDPPEIFPPYDSNRPEFFNRTDPNSVSYISGKEFHISSPISRVMEGLVNVSMIQNLGLPRGNSSMYLFRGPWGNLTERKCGDAEWTSLPKSRIPRELQRTKSFRDTQGVSFGLAKFSCLVQAEHVAMLFLVFSRNKYNGTKEMLEKELVNATKHLIKDLVNKPESGEKQTLGPQTGALVAFLIVKLNVGFNGSVHLSEPWTMLGVSPKNMSSLQCYSGTDVLNLTPMKENFTKRNENGYFKFGKEQAEYSDSAYYMCNSSNASDLDIGFQTRKLLVLPDASMMNIHLSLDSLKNDCNSSFDLSQRDGNNSFVYSDQRISVRLLYRKLTDLMSNVSAILNYTYVTHQHIITEGRTPEPGNNCTNATSILIEYFIVAPGAKESRGPINIRFILNYTNVTADEHDIEPPPNTVTISKSLKILIHPLAHPYLFLQHLSKLVLFDEIFNGWKTKHRENETGEEFSKSQSGKIFLENVVKVSDVQNLGLPRGQSYAYMFHEEKEMFPQQCENSDEADLGELDLNELEQRSSDKEELSDARSLTRGQNFVNKTFECVIQAEHYAIAFIIIVNKTAKPVEEMRNRTLKSIQSALMNWTGGGNHVYKRDEDTEYMFMTSVIIKLNVGWKASVHQGMPWMMLTHSGETQASKLQPKLSRVDKRGTRPKITSDRHFIYFTKNESEFEDSGEYSCEFQSGYDSPCFKKRRLFIRPNSLILKTYICHHPCRTIESTKSRCESYSVGTPVLMINGLTKYLCFIYISPTGSFGVDEAIKYTTLDGESNNGAKQVDRRTAGESVLSVYSVQSNENKAINTNFTLTLTYNNTNLDKKDVDRDVRIDPVSVSIIFTFELLITPHIYVSSLKANDVSLKRGLKEALSRTNEPVNFHKLQEVMLANENVFEVAVIFARGEPEGKITMKAIYEDQGQLNDNPCHPVRSEKVKKPGNLKCKKVHKNMLVNATFRCVLRQEHEVFSVLAFNLLGRESNDDDKTAKEREMRNSVLVWVGGVKEGKTHKEWTGATGTTVDMRIARMKIGWNQRVLTGSAVKMLGFLGKENTKDVECRFNNNKVDEKWRPVAEGPDAFYLTKQMIDCSDSGKYSCQVAGKVGFVSRFLIVEPDSSKIDLPLSEKPFEGIDWKDNWGKMKHGEPYIYTYSNIYAGCTSTCVYDKSWKHSEELIYSPGQKVDGKPYISQASLRYPHQISIEATKERTLNLTCKFTFNVPEFGSISRSKTRFVAIKQIVPPKLTMTESYVGKNIVQELKTPIESGRYFLDHHLSLSESVISLNLSVQLGTPTGWTKAWTFISYNKRLIREDCMILFTLSRNSAAEQKERGNITNVVYECILKPETVGLALTVSNIIEDITDQTTVDKTLYNSMKMGFERLARGENVTKEILESGLGSLFDYRMIRVKIPEVSSLAIGTPIEFLGYSYRVDRSTIHCSYKWNAREENAPVDDSFRIIPRSSGLGFRLLKPKAEFQDTGWYLCNITHDQVGGTSYIGFVSRHLWIIPDSSVVKLEINHVDIDVARLEGYGNFTQCYRNNVPFILCDQSAYLYCTFPVPATTRFNHEVQTFLDSTNKSPDKLRLRTLHFGSSRNSMQTEVYQITAPKVDKNFRSMHVTCTVNYTFTDKTTSLSVSRTIWIDRRVEPYIFLKDLNTPHRPEIKEAFLNKTQKPIKTAPSFHSSWFGGRALEGLVKVNYLAGLGIPRGDTEVSLFYRVKRVIKRSECINIKITNITGEKEPDLKDTAYFKKASGNNIVAVTAICQLTPTISAMMITAINAFGDSTSIKVVKRKFYRDASKVFRKWFDDPTSYTTTRLNVPEKSSLFQRSIRIAVGWRASVPSGSVVSMFGRALRPPSCTFDTKKVSGIIVRKTMFSSFEFIQHNVSADAAGLYRCRVEPTERYKSFFDQRLLVVFDGSIPLSLLFESLSTTKSDGLLNHPSHIIHISNNVLYLGQAVSAQCEYRKDRGSILHPPIYLEWEPKNISASTPVCSQSIDDKSIICSSKIRVQSDETMESTLNVSCNLYYGYNDSRYDVNCQYNDSFYQSTRSFTLKNRTTPLIKNESFETWSPDLGGALNNLTRSDIVFPYQIEEHQLTLNYSVSLGDPRGWTSVLLIFNHSGVLVFDECSTIKEKTDNSDEKISNVSYKCLLQPQHVGIFVYAVHIFSGGRKKMEVTEDIKDCLRRQFVSATSGRRMITLPEDCDGDNLLHKISVGWNASVEIHDNVRMIGQLGRNGVGKPVCYYRSGKKKQNLTDKGFTVNTMNGFIEISKSDIEYEDSGFYSCELADCKDCSNHLGLSERELLVLPNENTLSLRVQEEDRSDDNLQGCDNPKRIFKLGQEVSVRCSYELTWRLASIGTGLLLFDECRRLESGGRVAEASSVQTVETWDEDRLKIVEKTLSAKVPEKSGDWCIQCWLDFNATKLLYDLRSEVPPLRSFNKSEKYHIQHVRPPYIDKTTIKSSPVEEVGKRLGNDRFSLPSLGVIKQSHASPLIREGLLDITLNVDVGKPPGKVTAYVRTEGELKDDYCNISRPQGPSSHIQCLLLPELEALVIGVVNEPRTAETLREDLDKWLRSKSSESPESKCYYRDIRLVQLNVGWNATVWTDENVTFYGKMKDTSGNVTCTRRSYSNNDTENILGDQFSYSNTSIGEKLVLFALTITSVKTRNTGIYKCEKSGLPVLRDHDLQVLPRIVSLTMDPNKTDGNQLYLMSKTDATVTCKHDPIYGFGVNDTLLYEMRDSQTNQMKDVAYNMTKIEIENGTFSYTIVAVAAKDYVGPVRISCLSVLTLRNISKDISAHLGGEVLSSSVNVTIFEAANGDLVIRTVATDFETQPVPLGSEFTCTGGYGLPSLEYKWTCQSMDNNKSYADSPKESLRIDGVHVIVPDEDSFRGTSYTCTCEGYNTVLKKRYAITKAINITVLLCLTDEVEMDLTIVVNPCILRTCNFFPRYEKMLTQIIIGLPHRYDRVRFQFVAINTDEKTEPLPHSFDHDLTRRQLVGNLTDFQRTCSLTGGLNKVAEKLESADKPVTGRNYIVLLPVDNQTMNYPLETSSLVELNSSGVKFLTGFTHKIDGKFAKENWKFIEHLKPIKWSQLLPEFDYGACEDFKLRIHRKDLYDALCYSGGYREPGIVAEPVLQFIPSLRQFYPGINLVVICAAPAWTLEHETRHIEISLCLTNKTKLDELSKYKKPNIQRLRRTCNVHLTEKTVRGPLNNLAVSERVKLPRDDLNSFVLCYQRRGGRSPKVYDPTNYTAQGITVGETIFEKPELSIIQRPCGEERGARLKCRVKSNFANMRGLLVAEYPASKKETDRFVVITRSEFSSPFLNLLMEANLNWVQTPEDITDITVYCVAMPVWKDDLKQEYASLWQDNKKDNIRVSDGQHLNMSANRPSTPEMKIEPDFRRKLPEFGSRLEITCEANTTSEGLPLQLMYLTTNYTIILCTNGTLVPMLTSRHTPVPCMHLTPSAVEDCSQSPVDLIRTDNTYYPAICSLYFSSELKIYVRQIRLVVTTLRMVDFGARVFCRTVDPFVKSVPSDKPRDLLTTRVEDVRYRITPYIEDFHFDQSREEWYCSAVGFPHSDEGSIEEVNAKPGWLKAQLSGFVSLLLDPKLRILNEHLLPLGTNDSKYRGQFDLAFRSPVPIPEGLTKGLVIVQCNFSGQIVRLETRTGKKPFVEEPLVSETGVIRADQPVRLQCWIDLVPNTTVDRIAFHRTVHYFWMKYDVTVLTISPADVSKRRSDMGKIEKEIHLSAHWAISSVPTVRVLYEKRGRSVGVEIVNVFSTEFDSGQYYCTAYAMGKFLKARPIAVSVLGRSKNITFGCRTVKNYTLWKPQLITLNPGDIYQTMCMVWSTDPYDRVIDRLLLENSERQTDSNLTVKILQHPSRIVLGKAQQYQLIELEGTTDALTCLLEHHSTTHRSTISSSRVECSMPDLTWTPKDQLIYSNKEVITCVVRSSCIQPYIIWQWLAGPIPQLTLSADEVQGQTVSEGERLYLSRLPRGGTYLFSCSATCVCASGTYSNSIDVQLFLDDSDIESNLELEDPDHFEPEKEEEIIDRDLTEVAEEIGTLEKETESIEEFGRIGEKPKKSELDEDELNELPVADGVDITEDARFYPHETRLLSGREELISLEAPEEEISAKFPPPHKPYPLSDLREGYFPVAHVDDKWESDEDSARKRIKKRLGLALTSYPREDQLPSRTDRFPAGDEVGGLDIGRLTAFGEFLGGYGVQRRPSDSGYLVGVRKQFGESADVFGLSEAERHFIEKGEVGSEDISLALANYAMRMEQFKDRVMSDLPGRDESSAMRYEVTNPLGDKEQVRGPGYIPSSAYSDEEFASAIRDRLKADGITAGVTSSGAFRSEFPLPDISIGRGKQRLYDIQKEAAYHGVSEDEVEDSFLARYDAIRRRDQQRYKVMPDVTSFGEYVTDASKTDVESRPFGVQADGRSVLIRTGRDKLPPRLTSQDERRPSIEERKGKLFAYDRTDEEPIPSYGADSGIADWDDDEKIPASLAKAIRLHAIRKDVGSHTRLVPHKDRFSGLFDGTGYDSDQVSRDILKYHTKAGALRDMLGAKGPLVDDFSEQVDDWPQSLGVIDFLDETIKPLTSKRRLLPSISSQLNIKEDKKQESSTDILDGSKAGINLLQRQGYYHGGRRSIIGEVKKGRELTLSSEELGKSVPVRSLDRPYAKYEELPVAALRLRDQTVGTEALSEETRSMDWTFHPRTQTYTLAKDVRSGALAEDYRGWLKRMDIVKKVSDSNYPVKLSKGIKSQFTQSVTPLSDTKSLTSTGNLWMKHMNVSQPASWMRPVVKLMDVFNRDFGMEFKNTSKMQVILSPDVLQLPGTTTVRCPKVEKSLKPGYQPSYITWLHIPGSNIPHSADKEEIIRFSLIKREIQKLSTRDGLHNRTFIFPPKKWSDSSTLDITELVPADCGYYACSISFGSHTDRAPTINVTKVSTTPLCIVPALRDPTISVAQMNSEMVPDSRHNVNETDTSCYYPGDQILIRCDATAHQLFCERSDYVLHGHRIIETELEAKVSRVHHGRMETLLAMNSVPPNLRNATLTIPGDRVLVASQWRATIRPHFHEAFLTCTMRPKLVVPHSGVPPYWNHLVKEFHRHYNHVLRRRSQSLRLCVSHTEQELHIYPAPSIERTDQTEPATTHILQLWPNQIISCETLKQYKQPPILKFFRIMKGKVDVARKLGMDGLPIWHNVKMKPVQWINITDQKRTKVIISPKEDSIDHFFVVCDIDQTNLTESLILQVVRDRGVHMLPLDISKGVVCLVLGLILVLLYLLKHPWRRIRGTRSYFGKV
ncbi:unnamed protein product [Calicophoron daubneyi]|uniref:Soluble interferon alpha/beta receptor OPG204 n=1 Tax=Calicophoron daubneyi TaxID=300641 RepID=A0AAV2TL59_CALDB